MKTIFSFLFLAFGLADLRGQTPQLVVPLGHSDKIVTLAYSPDGKYILTGSWDHTAKLWDMDGRLICTITDTLRFRYLTFSPNGKFILGFCEPESVSDKYTGSMRLYDLYGNVLQTFEQATLPVTFLPDGKRILANGIDNKTRMWDLNGHVLKTYRKEFSNFTTLTCTPITPDDPAGGKYFLTGNERGLVRLWNSEGNLVQEFKAPGQKSGHPYEISHVDISSDGKMLLTSGLDGIYLWRMDGHLIRSFDGFYNAALFMPDDKKVLTASEGDGRATLIDLNGKVLQTFAGQLIHSNVISPDGKRLLTLGEDCCASKVAILWDIDGRKVQTFSGHVEETDIFSSVAFSPNDGGKRLLTFGGNSARMWDIERQAIQVFNGHTKPVTSAVFSPDGMTVLTAGKDGVAKLWDLKGRELISIVADKYKVNSAAFSPDGKTVLTSHPDLKVKIWDLNGKEIRTITYPGGNNLFESVFSPDGQRILALADYTENSVVVLWDLNGKEIQTIKGFGPVVFSKDSKQILGAGFYGQFYTEYARLWDIDQHQQTQVFGARNGKLTRCVALSPDGKNVLTGHTDGTAKLWDLDGREIHTLLGHLGWVTTVAFSPAYPGNPGGKYILTGSADKTAKIWDSDTGKELATLLILDSIHWVVTTPSGLFDASPGAMKLMYYVQGLEVIELEQLKERYYEPGLLAKVMGLSKETTRSVEAFNSVALYPEMTAQLSENKLSLHVNLVPRNGGIGKLSVFVNSKEVQEDANPQRAQSVNIDLTRFADYYLPGENNKLELRVYNQAGWLKSSALELDYQPPAIAHSIEQTDAPNPASSLIKQKPALYALIVGTANYAGDKLDLQYSDHDASAFSQALRMAASQVFGDKVTITLLNTDASDDTRQGVSSKTSVKKAFADVVARAKAPDVLVVYFSGHGVNYGTAETGQFYYLTKDISSENLADPEVRNSFAISSAELTEWIKAIPALKQVMILDACYSGKIVEDLATGQKDLNSSQVRALDRMKDRTGMFILTGSAADKVSYEASQYGQGLLTYSLLQGMSGLALTEDKRVDVMTLFQYSRDKVPELAKGIGGVQAPVLAFPAGGASFDIGIVNAGVKIQVAQVKPVFIRNVFQDEASFDDVLGLTDALETYFHEITAKGAQAELIFVDVKEYERAYSMKGLYKVTGDTVEVRGRLFQGKDAVGEFQVSGLKNAVPALAEKIIKKVSDMLK